MKSKSVPRGNHFPSALKTARLARGLAQEEFDEVSGRTYISALELGKKSPTLQKIDQLALPLGLHPLSLLVLSYIDGSSPDLGELQKLLDSVSEEVLLLLGPKTIESIAPLD